MKQGDMHNRADGRQWAAFMRCFARIGNPVQTGISKFHGGIWGFNAGIGCTSHVVLVFSVRWRPAKIIHEKIGCQSGQTEREDTKMGFMEDGSEISCKSN